MDIVLIAGMWLDGSAWDLVVPELEALGHRPHRLTLPGQGDGVAAATYDDQVATVLAAVDAAEGPALVVGHSAACALAWVAADARPDKVAGVALVGGMPNADGETYFGAFEPVDGHVPFPGWEPFEGPDSDDMSDDLKASVAAGAIAVPAAITHGVVRLSDDRRYDVPVTMVCPEYSPADAKEWVAAATSLSWPGPRRWTTSTSTPVTGRCSPDRPSWPESWPTARRTDPGESVVGAGVELVGVDGVADLGVARRLRRQGRFALVVAHASAGSWEARGGTAVVVARVRI